jgi:MFS family permease
LSLQAQGLAQVELRRAVCFAPPGDRPDQYAQAIRDVLCTPLGHDLDIALQTPIGAAIDVTHAKRGVIVLTMAAMIVAAIIIFVAPTFWPMAIALGVVALAGDAFAPAVSALTLGLVPRAKLARRLGRNSAFDHGGNIAIALLAGAVGYAFSQRAVFLMVPVFAP